MSVQRAGSSAEEEEEEGKKAVGRMRLGMAGEGKGERVDVIDGR
jgi:hypothetical protein